MNSPDDRAFRYGGIAALIASMAVTLVVMMRMSSGSVDTGLLLFAAWAISPYLVFLAAGALIQRFTSIRGSALLISAISVLMLAFTLFTYISGLTGESSTESLVFVAAPVILYIGSFSLLAVGLLIGSFMARKTDAG